MTGEETDASSSSKTVFESTNEPESQRQVSSGEAFTYVFPLRVLHTAHADDVRITLYLFKYHEARDLSLKGSLDVISRRETLDGDIKRVTRPKINAALI